MTVNKFYDYYLSVPTEADMPEIPEGAALDVIGTWFDYDPETETSTSREGWHFNVRSMEPIEWSDTVVQYQPSSPWRVWG